VENPRRGENRLFHAISTKGSLHTGAERGLLSFVNVSRDTISSFLSMKNSVQKAVSMMAIRLSWV